MKDVRSNSTWVSVTKDYARGQLARSHELPSGLRGLSRMGADKRE